MSDHISIRKVFEGLATRQQMFSLFDRHAKRPTRGEDDPTALYAGEWFEISEAEHDYMASRHESGESVRHLRTYPELRLV